MQGTVEIATGYYFPVRNTGKSRQRLRSVINFTGLWRAREDRLYEFVCDRGGVASCTRESEPVEAIPTSTTLVYNGEEREARERRSCSNVFTWDGPVPRINCKELLNLRCLIRYTSAEVAVANLRSFQNTRVVERERKKKESKGSKANAVLTTLH